MAKNIHKLLKEKQVAFEENDIAVLYSDGITEAINMPKRTGEEQMFGEERLLKAIENAPEAHGKTYKTAKSVFKNITIELSKFMGYKYTQLDDITLAVIHYKGDDYDISKDYEDKISEDLITEWNWEK
jgi:serine phosphatase RsbU (regulator of sigma subunit)